MKYPHLAARIFNTPLLIHPQKLDAIIAGLGDRLIGCNGLELGSDPDSGALPADMFSTRRVQSDLDMRDGYNITDGVAVIFASGALVHRGRLEGVSTRLLGYNDLAMATEDALADSDVHAVLHIMDTPGGEAQGAFEYHDRLRDMRGKKPIWGIADGLAASAGYLAAAALDEFAITKTGYAGSIGVVMRHVDFSAALAQGGIRVTHIYAGAHKVDGNPYESLPTSVRADFQAEIDSLYQMFIEAVASGRRMDPEAVRKTQAQTFRGNAAVAAGLADRISTTDQMISELASLRARSYPVGQSSARATANDKGEIHMSGNSAPAGDDKQPATGFTQADIDKARAEGVEQGAQAERERVGAILDHESASCSPLAMQCINTGLTAEQSTAILGAAPAATASAQGSAFAAAMGAIGNPDVSGIESAAAPENAEAALAADIVGLFSATRQ